MNWRHSGAIVAALVLLLPRLARAQAPLNPHGASVGACAECHSADAWRPAHIAPTFRHAEKIFPLDGAHSGTPCTTCHKSLDFSKAPTTCASCHDDVHRGELGVDCARCHSTRSFVDQARLGRMHEETRFPLRGAHAAAPCESCHIPGAAGQVQYRGLPTTCMGCHRADYDHAANPPHAGAGFPSNCESCHTESTWQGATFDHNGTSFPLTGAHQAVACSSCHGDGVFKGKPTACAACHQADYDKTTDPPHAAAAFGTTCSTCHTTTAWQGATFDHNTTAFPLTGGHQAVACSSCHGDGVFKGKPTACAACHQADYDKTTDPPHAAAAFGTTCSTCHTTTAWQGATFDHNTTQFPLTGGHQAVACSSCHGDGVFKGKSTACAACHQADYDKTTDPPHAASGFATTCATCHTTASWTGATFDHNTTPFPLTGAHLAVACAACHGDGVFKGKPTACVACHQADFDKTTDPPHGAAGFATTCATCHTTVAWTGATFDHSTTQFPLTGAHQAVPCSGCHSDGVYKGKPTTCVSCHQADFDKTTDPDHKAAGYSTDCTTCHTTASWQGANFDHNTTAFPLTGAHQAVPCTGCHADGVFKGKSTACASCHQPDFDKTTDPPHAAAGFATTCADCHTTIAWTGASFDHSTTQFPLTGAHLALPCSSCHSDGVFKGKPTACVACHQPDFDKTTDPPHAASGFPTTCADCHTTATWSGASFDHNKTAFPLTGAHLAVACSGCHGDGVFKGKPTTCVSCHQSDYDKTTDPPHGAAGFATTCADCHTTAAWTGATFDHNTTQFPLTGAHVTLPCSSCHADGVFKGKATTCASCHQTDYNNTTDPNHQAASFPTTCESCHTTATWAGATFDHDGKYFPIYSGTHKSVWTSCATCHTASSDYTVFSCTTGCHGKSGTDSDHKGVSGYQYVSTACYSCHPKGKAD